MKNKHIYTIFILFIIINLSSCTSTNKQVNIGYENVDYTKMNLDLETITESYKNTPSNDITITLPEKFETMVDSLNSVNDRTITDLVKMYKYHIDKNDTENPISDNLDSIQKVKIIDYSTSELTLNSNTIYFLGYGQYYLDFILGKNIENVIIIGKGINKTIVIGAVGIFSCKDIVMSNLAVYYEKNDDLAYSSIALINSDNVLLDMVWTLNSSNGIELSESSCLMLNSLSTNNKNTNIYAYNNSTLDISKSIISESNYNGIYTEESSVNIYETNLSDNGYSGIYLRESNSTINSCNFINNSKYGIQLKSSRSDISFVNFENSENSFDYEGDIYYNYSSKFDISNSDIENINIKQPEIITVKNQTEMEEALNYAKVNDNVIINIHDGNYIVESIISESEDIYIRGDNNDDVDFSGYMAFASCYDISMENIDFEFKGVEAFNVMEFKNCYFVNIKNFRVINSKQNGIQITNSKIMMNNFYAVKSDASGIALINSEANIIDSLFEKNKASGITSIRSIVDMDKVTCRDNSTYNGLSVLESDISINNSNFINNGNSGISAENSIIEIDASKLSGNSLAGLDIISSKIDLESVNIENNMAFGLEILEECEVEAENLYISSNQIGGVHSEGNSIININRSIIRKSSEYGIKVDGNNSESITFNNIQLTNLKYGLYSENSIIKLKSSKIDNINDTALYIIKNSSLYTNGITFGENVNSQYFTDSSSNITEIDD